MYPQRVHRTDGSGSTFNPSTPRRARSGDASWLLVAAIIVTAASFGPSHAAAQTVIVQGSTTFNSRLMEPHQKAIETLSGVTLKIIPNKSLNGLMALLEGRADLAMISAPLESEIANLRTAKPDLPYERLRNHEIDSTRISFAVHPSNPIRDASLDTVRRILLGSITNWRELGGPDLPIRVVFVRSSGGITHTVQTLVLAGKPIAAPNVIPLESPLQVIKVTQQEPAALGLAQIQLVKASKLSEFTTDETVQQQLHLVTLGEATPAVRAVIEAARRVAESKLASSQP